MTIETINTDKAPAAIGPYSQAKRVGDFLFVSGQIPLDRSSGDIVGDDIVTQTRQVIANLVAVLEAGGSSVDKVLKTTCYLTSMDDFADFNKVYEETFSASKPARACVEVSSLPKGVLCEIDAVAVCAK